MEPRVGNPPPHTLGERIRRLRLEKGWTQRELARRVGLKPALISKYERGNHQPGLAAVKAIADALGTTADHLAGKSEPAAGTDARLKGLLSRLDELPAEQRSNLAQILEALLKIHSHLSLSTRPRKPKNT